MKTEAETGVRRPQPKIRGTSEGTTLGGALPGASRGNRTAGPGPRMPAPRPEPQASLAFSPGFPDPGTGAEAVSAAMRAEGSALPAPRGPRAQDCELSWRSEVTYRG